MKRSTSWLQSAFTWLTLVGLAWVVIDGLAGPSPDPRSGGASPARAEPILADGVAVETAAAPAARPRGPTPGMIRGRVVDDAGRPLWKTRVILAQTGRDDTAGTGGWFEFADVAPDRYTLQLDPSTVPPGVHKPLRGANHWAVVVPPEGGVVLTDIVLPRPSHVVGRVLDAEGRPVSGALLNFSSGYGDEKRTATSADDGTFEFGGAREGWHRLVVRFPADHPLAAAISPDPLVFRTVPGRNERFDLALQDGPYTVRGVVVDQHMQPFPGVQVECLGLRGSDGTTPKLVGHRMTIATTDANGRYEITDLPAREVRLVFTSDDWGVRWTGTPESRRLAAPVKDLVLAGTDPVVEVEPVTLHHRSLFRQFGWVYWKSGVIAMGGSVHLRITVAPPGALPEAEEDLRFMDGLFHWEAESLEPVILRIYARRTGEVVHQQLITPRRYAEDSIDLRLEIDRPRRR